MASLIKIKRSAVSGNPAILAAGELAYSGLPDNGSNGGDRLYIGMGSETAGNAANHVVIGGKYFTDTINAATSGNTANTLVKRDSAGSITVQDITVQGVFTGTIATANRWYTPRNLTISGDATGTFSNVDGSSNVNATVNLATVNNNVGTYGSVTAVPIITVNAKGLITGVSTASISTVLSVAGNTGVDTVTIGTDTLTFAGGTGVTTVASDNQISFAIGQDVSTTANVTFNNVSVNGTLSSDDITAANISVNGNATITGNLLVQGTTTTVNSTAVSIADVNITLAKNATSAGEADGAGITVAGPTTAATLTYTSTDDRWNFNKNLNVTTVYGALSGNASTASAWQTARNLSLTGDATATLSAVDGTANVSAAVTLATVNSDVGSFGNSVTVPTITVNAKGLVTGVTSTAIPDATPSVKGIASFAGANFAVSNGAVSLATVNSNVGNFGDSVTVPSFTVNSFGQITAASSTAIPYSTSTVKGLASFNSGSFSVVGGAVSLATVNSNVGTYGDSTSVPTITVNGSGQITAVSQTAIPYATSSVKGLASFDSGNFDVSSGAVTLATVNVNVGTYGDAVTVPTFTVDGKGLITAASQTAIPYATSSVKGLASFSTDNFTVTNGAVAITTLDGGTY